MSIKERPMFALGAYEQTTKTALFLAFCDLLAEEAGTDAGVGALDDDRVIAEINRRACALRTAGWSTMSGRDAPRRGRRGAEVTKS